MKRMLSLLLMFVLLACFAVGCGAAGPNNQATVSPPGTFAASDMVFHLDGKAYEVKTDSTALLAALGDDRRAEEAISCLFDGMDKSFDYGDILISTYPIGGKDVIEEITIFSDKYPTAKGIKVGQSADEAVKAYGAGGILDGDILTYMLTDAGDSPRLYFQINAENIITLISYFGGTGL